MYFLAFEGLDGSGKSTLIRGLKTEIEGRGIPLVVTREPGGTALGDEVRELLLRVKGDTPVKRAEALLYQAGRAQHVEQVIQPALKAGKWVLSDRFDASSIAFQAGGRDISRSEIEWLNRFSTGGLRPHLNILLDLTTEESARRLSTRGQATDRFEREAQDFHEKVRRAYLALAQERPAEWLVLPAGESPEAILKKLIVVLKDRKWLV